MKLNKKLSLVAAAMFAVSPVVTSVSSTQPVLAAKKKSTINNYVKKNIISVKNMTDFQNLKIQDSSDNPLKVSHIRIYRGTPEIGYKKIGNGKKGQGKYGYAQGLKGVGFPQSDTARTYLIELPVAGVGGIVIGKFNVPANSTTGKGYVSFTTVTNAEGNKFNLPHMWKAVSYVEPKKVKKNKKSVKKTKKSHKSSKKVVHKAKK